MFKDKGTPIAGEEVRKLGESTGQASLKNESISVCKWGIGLGAMPERH